MISTYDSVYQKTLDELHQNLSSDLSVLPTLNQEKQSKTIAFLLGLACQATHVRNIQLGRIGLKSIPLDWLLNNIEREVNACLNLEDEWEFRRLTEIYFEVDTGLAKRLAQIGLQSENEEVVEAAEDLLDWIADVGEKNE